MSVVVAALVEATAARVWALAESRPPTLGSGRLVCIDGPAGSGKSTLAQALAAPTVHMDDLYEGWSGLREGTDQHVLGILEPLSRDRPGSYRRWDWARSARAEHHLVTPAPRLVLEGVGSGNRAWAPLITVLVWVSTDPATALARGHERDNADAVDGWTQLWKQWAVDEDEVFTRERTRARADIVVPT